LKLYRNAGRASSGATAKGWQTAARVAIDLCVTRFDSTDRAFAIGLAALAGYVDAIGFLGTGGFFVSFMSGNTTRLGVGLASLSSDAGVAARLIIMFIGGVTIGTLIARAAGAQRRVAMLALIAGLLGLAAGLGGAGWPGLAIALLALVMGMENTVLDGDGEVRVGITYMTGTLVRVGQRLAAAIAGGPALDCVPHLMLWTVLMAGAWIGASSYFRYGFASLWGAVLVALILAAVSAFARRSAP
jgi:uncharacterized membrane protein YoaK (UPF0700 family)